MLFLAFGSWLLAGGFPAFAFCDLILGDFLAFGFCCLWFLALWIGIS